MSIMTERPIAYIIDSRGQTHFNFVVVYANGERAMCNTVGTPFAASPPPPVEVSEDDSCRHKNWGYNSLDEPVCHECGKTLETWAQEVKIMPRGGVERNWWEEYQLLLRRFKKLGKAARQCVDEVDANLAKDDWPVKYRAPFEGLTNLREALPETYEEFKSRAALSAIGGHDAD